MFRSPDTNSYLVCTEERAFYSLFALEKEIDSCSYFEYSVTHPRRDEHFIFTVIDEKGTAGILQEIFDRGELRGPKRFGALCVAGRDPRDSRTPSRLTVVVHFFFLQHHGKEFRFCGFAPHISALLN